MSHAPRHATPLRSVGPSRHPQYRYVVGYTVTEWLRTFSAAITAGVTGAPPSAAPAATGATGATGLPFVVDTAANVAGRTRAPAAAVLANAKASLAAASALVGPAFTLRVVLDVKSATATSQVCVS